MSRYPLKLTADDLRELFFGMDSADGLGLQWFKAGRVSVDYGILLSPRKVLPFPEKPGRATIVQYTEIVEDEL